MHIFVDESGDAGFKFRQGSSRYFVVYLLVIEDVQAFERALLLFRNRRGLTAGDELKFMSARTTLRDAFFSDMRNSECAVHVRVVDKHFIAEPHGNVRQTFHRDQVIEALCSLAAPLDDATIVIDEFTQGPKSRQAHITEIRQRMRATGGYRPRRITLGSARTHPLLQVVDMYCGMIAASLQPSHRAPEIDAMDAHIVEILRIPADSKNP